MAPRPPSAHSLTKRPCLLPMAGLVLSRPSPANQLSLTPWSPTPPPCGDPPQNGLILIVCAQDYRTRSMPRFQGLPGPKTTPESVCAPPLLDACHRPISPSHSRHPSTLCQGIPIKDGIIVARSGVGLVKQGTFFHSISHSYQPIAVQTTFGSINVVSAAISSPTFSPQVRSRIAA